MRFSDAFKETVFRFDLKGAEIAARSGLTEAQVSHFKRGNNLRIDSVEKILDALPLEARLFMLGLVANDDASSLSSQPPKDSVDAE